jgi:hypothetical protein
VKAGKHDLDWIAGELDEDIEPTEPQEPASLISRRASAIGLSHERAIERGVNDAERAKSKSPLATAIKDNAYRLDRIAATELSLIHI